MQIKVALKRFAKTRYTIDDLVEKVEDPSVIIPIRDLLSGTKSKSYSKKTVPGIHKAIMNFLKRKEIYISLDFDDDQLVKSTVSDITTMTGVTAGRAASFDEGFGVIGDPSKISTSDASAANNNDDQSAQTHITGVTVNKIGGGKTVVITNIDKKDNNNKINSNSNKSKNTAEEEASQVTMMTGITGIENDKGQQKDNGNEVEEEGSQGTTISGITMTSNKNKLINN
eukprot:15337802-Ditylum_brightwellii.AAC.1